MRCVGWFCLNVNFSCGPDVFFHVVVDVVVGEVAWLFFVNKVVADAVLFFGVADDGVFFEAPVMCAPFSSVVKGGFLPFGGEHAFFFEDVEELTVLWVKYIVDDSVVEAEDVHDKAGVSSCFVDTYADAVGDGSG